MALHLSVVGLARPASSNANTGLSFTFGVAGDIGLPSAADAAAWVERMKGANATFLLALGDLGYTADEQGWCSALKANFDDIEVIAGNHDSTESGPGDIAQDVTYCPFTLGVNVTGGPGTPGNGYGYEYYFDYPATTPLARFILIAAGVGGQLNYDYSPGSAHYNWVVNAVSDARFSGIPWVIVGMHKQCITVGGKPGCEMGQAIFDKLVDLKVDLILHGHDHVYERSKQLALGANCTSVSSAGAFDADCVATDGSNGLYWKGAGSVDVVQGTGGAGQSSVGIDGSDPEMGYFVSVMGINANTQGLSGGYGYVRYVVTLEDIIAETDFCPGGSTDAIGQCPSRVASTFKDRFTIASRAPVPVARFTHSPSWPRADDLVTFDASGSSAPSPHTPLEARWDWENDGAWDTSWSSAIIAQHRFPVSGVVTVRLQVRNVFGFTNVSVDQVIVDSEPPVTNSSLFGTAGTKGWFTSAVTVTLTASDGLSGVAETAYRVDGAAWQTYSGPFLLGDGRHVLEYRAADAAGVMEPTNTARINVDTTGPVFENAAPLGVTTTSDVTVSWEASDLTSGLAEFELSVDGGPFVSVGGNRSGALTLSDGPHRVTLKAIDAAGNVGMTTIVFRVDTNPFSPTGPYSGILTSFLIESIIAATTIFFILRRRKRTGDLP